MSVLACMRAERSLERRAAGLSSAQALRLEEHLSTCEKCSEHARLLSSLSALSQSGGSTLDYAARERAFSGAFATARAVQPVRPELRVLRVGLGVFAAALALLVFFTRDAWLPSAQDAGVPAVATRAPQRTPASKAQQDRVLAGRIEVAGRTAAVGDALASDVQLMTHSGGTLALAHAQATLRPATLARWSAKGRVLELQAGSVLVEVDPGVGQSFAITTPEFHVVVLGTRFTVSMTGVQVSHGKVRVLALDGRELAVLGAGEHFEHAQLAGPSAAASAQGVDGKRARDQAREDDAQPRPRADGALLLLQARTQLAEGQVARARKSLDAALAARLAPAQRAEAMSLRAESALVEGDHAGAVEAYLRVARAFSNLPAGENALFAAARLEAERGRSAAAAQAFSRYLDRHPQGRFVKEARARLRELNAVLDHAP